MLAPHPTRSGPAGAVGRKLLGHLEEQLDPDWMWGGHPSIRPNPPAQLSRQVCGGCPHRGPDRLITRSKHLLALRDLAINIPLPPTSTHHTTWPDAPTEVMNLYSRAKAEITPPTPLSAVEEECRSWVSRTILFLASSQIDERRCGIDHHHLDWSKAKAGAEVPGSRQWGKKLNAGI